MMFERRLVMFDQTFITAAEEEKFSEAQLLDDGKRGRQRSRPDAYERGQDNYLLRSLWRSFAQVTGKWSVTRTGCIAGFAPDR